ncbi:hypothetical protein ACFYO1_35970 [Nocardia sp. NPDC006044]|uniref:hypothetical protein n=1 Tax=Nocardia sp. NPDC006044 TaxID=3364306 RepID=UPI0036AC70DA
MNTHRRPGFPAGRAAGTGFIAGWPAVDIRPLRQRDRLWCRVPVLKVIRSIVVPEVEEVRARLAEWRAVRPDDARVRLLDVEHGRTGQPAPGWAAAFVRALVTSSAEDCPADGSPAPDVRDLGGLPFRLTLGREWAQFSYSHALADGTASWDFLGWLLALGNSRDLGSDRCVRPLARGLLATFCRSGSKLPQAVSVQREMRHLRTEGDRRVVNVVGPPSFTTTAVASSESFVQGARRFRAERGSAASVMSIMTLRALLLCRHHGLQVDGTVVFMVDLRRYLAGRGSVDGNFSWSKSVPVLDSDTPTELSARIGSIVDSGLPLLVFGQALQRKRIHRSGPPSVRAGGNGPVRLMMSYGTRWPAAPPPAGSAPPRITVSIAPPGPNFLGFNVVEAYDRLHVSVNRCGEFDRALVGRIATDFVADLGTGPIDESLWAR